MKKRTTRTKGKRVVLKGYFHISTQELYDVVVKAEKETKRQARKRAKTKSKNNYMRLRVKRILKKKVRVNLRARLEIVL